MSSTSRKEPQIPRVEFTNPSRCAANAGMITCRSLYHARMNHPLRISMVLFAAVLALSSPPASSAQTHARMLRGTPVTGNEARAMAVIFIKFNNQTHFCSGTLVGPSTVLTAAHCHPPGSELTVLIDGHIVTPAGVFTNPLYLQTEEEREEANASLADIAQFDLTIIQLPEPMSFEPVPIAAGATLQVGDVVQIAGFGTNEKEFPRTVAGLIKNLRFGRSVITSVSDHTFEFYTAAKSVFAGDHTRYASVCQGDSGGAVFSTNQTNRFLLGLHSAGANQVVEGRCQLGYNLGEPGAGVHNDLNAQTSVDFLTQFDSILWISATDLTAKAKAIKIDAYLRAALGAPTLPLRKHKVLTARRLLMRDLSDLNARDQSVTNVLSLINENLLKVSRRPPLIAARQTLKTILSHFAVRKSYVRSETL